MGYIHDQPNIGTTIKLDPLGFVAKLEDLPILPTSGTERLRLLFTVTTGCSAHGVALPPTVRLRPACNLSLGAHRSIGDPHHIVSQLHRAVVPDLETFAGVALGPRGLDGAGSGQQADAGQT